MTMDAETQKDVEHLLDDQIANIRAAYEDAIKGAFADPIIWLFNLELEDSREVAIGIMGEKLREQLKPPRSPDVIPSCLMATERQDATNTFCGAAAVHGHGANDRRATATFERQSTVYAVNRRPFTRRKRNGPAWDILANRPCPLGAVLSRRRPQGTRRVE
jgi:hypothetical protein